MSNFEINKKQYPTWYLRIIVHNKCRVFSLCPSTMSLDVTFFAEIKAYKVGLKTFFQIVKLLQKSAWLKIWKRTIFLHVNSYIFENGKGYIHIVDLL